jgi:uncharacterized protein (TIGR03437 family)
LSATWRRTRAWSTSETEVRSGGPSKAEDGELNASDNPAPQGSTVVAYVTGQGGVDPPIATGAVAGADPLSVPRLLVRATIGGAPVRVVFAGMTPGFAGLMQANIDTAGAPPGEQELIVFINDVASNAGLVYIAGN